MLLAEQSLGLAEELLCRICATFSRSFRLHAANYQQHVTACDVPPVHQTGSRSVRASTVLLVLAELLLGAGTRTTFLVGIVARLCQQERFTRGLMMATSVPESRCRLSSAAIALGLAAR